MTFDEYSALPNKKWYQVTAQGYFEAGAASRDVEIAKLEQKLATMTKERDKAKAMPMKYRRMEFNAQLQNEAESLHKQLDEAQTIIKEKEGQRQNLMEAFRRQGDSAQEEICRLRKQVTLLRDALITIRDEPVETDEHDGIEPHVVASEALAATDDLSGYILCEKEPVIDSMYVGNTFQPLYRARKPKP